MSSGGDNFRVADHLVKSGKRVQMK